MMSKKQKIRLSYLAIPLLVPFCLVFEQISTHRLMAEIDRSNRKIVLKYVTQTASRIKDKFAERNASLKELERDIGASSSFGERDLLAHLQKYESAWETDASGVLLSDGRAMLSDGTFLQFTNENTLNDVVNYAKHLNISRQ